MFIDADDVITNSNCNSDMLLIQNSRALNIYAFIALYKIALLGSPTIFIDIIKWFEDNAKIKLELLKYRA